MGRYAAIRRMILVATAMMAASGLAQAAAPSLVLDDYVLFAIDTLRSKGLVVDDGDVGVGVGSLRISRHGFLDARRSRIVAGSVMLPPAAQCSQLYANAPWAQSPACGPAEPFAAPVIPDVAAACGFPVPFPACDPGAAVTVNPGEDCPADTVPGNGICDLPAGVYGALRLRDDATISMSGDYVFCDFVTGRAAHVYFDGGSQVSVVGTIAVRNDTFVGPAPLVRVPVDDITLFSNGKRGHISRRADLSGLLCAPLASFRMTEGATLHGRAVVRSLRTERVRLQRGHPERPVPPPPTTTTTSTSTTTTSSTTVPSGPCIITISVIEGAVVNVAGNLTALTDPHQNGRIFVDTIALRPIGANPDEEWIVLGAEMPPAIDPDDYEVRWEARDPDDPASHRDVDPNDGGTAATPVGTLARGGDNRDRLPEQGAHFFRENLPQHAVRAQASPGSGGDDANRVIGTARTAIDNDRSTTVRFHYGDEGGDNYIIRAACIRRATGAVESEDQTGVMTTWRQRFLDVTGMAKTADDVKTCDGGATPPVPCIDGGTNHLADSYLQGDDKYEGNIGTAVVVGVDLTRNTVANNGGPTYRPGADLADVTAAFKAAYANLADPDRNPYIEFDIRETATATGWDGLTSTADQPTYVQNETPYHGGPGNNLHDADRYHLVGVRALDRPDDPGKMRGNFGDSNVGPHSYVGLLAHYERFEVGGTTASEIRQTIVHEVAHGLLRRNPLPPTDLHGVHSGAAGTTWGQCAGRTNAGQGVAFCPLHARLLRENATRTWPNHDPTVATVLEATRDSD